MNRTSLFPLEQITIRRYLRRVTLTISPLTLRQHLAIDRGMTTVLTASTGKPAKWFRGVPRPDLQRLLELISRLNSGGDWLETVSSPTMTKADGAAFSFEELVALLIRNGHRWPDILDYTIDQFIRFAKLAIVWEEHSRLRTAQLDVPTIRSAVWADKQHLCNYLSELQKAAKKVLEEGATDKAPDSQQKQSAVWDKIKPGDIPEGYA